MVTATRALVALSYCIVTKLTFLATTVWLATDFWTRSRSRYGDWSMVIV